MRGFFFFFFFFFSFFFYIARNLESIPAPLAGLAAASRSLRRKAASFAWTFQIRVHYFGSFYSASRSIMYSNLVAVRPVLPLTH